MEKMILLPMDRYQSLTEGKQDTPKSLLNSSKTEDWSYFCHLQNKPFDSKISEIHLSCRSFGDTEGSP